MKSVFLLVMMPLVMFTRCGNSSRKTKEVIIFHAGSLAVPFRDLKEAYEKRNPGIKILLEPAGSLVCARKITELRKPCDIIASADYFVINELLIPEYTKWSIRFASNEIVIAYTAKAKHSAEIDSSNWFDILLMNDVIYSRSDPDADPCGYRAVLTMKLAEKYYKKPGLAEKLMSKDRDFIRPKEVDLVSLIESGAADYMFQYKSVAIQHGLKFIALPDDINLSDPAKNDIYKTVSTEVTGKGPGTKMKVTGEYINYSISVLDKAPDRDEALDFLCFILSREGQAILARDGQKPIVPFLTDQPDKLPEKIVRCMTDLNVK
jgi:molybdate/tungstate transport system substrate-binding protein